MCQCLSNFRPVGWILRSGLSVPNQWKKRITKGLKCFLKRIIFLHLLASPLPVLFIFIFFSFRNSVRLVIRKVQYAPETPGPQPMVETTRSFLMSDRSLHLEASLDKEVSNFAYFCEYLQV